MKNTEKSLQFEIIRVEDGFAYDVHLLREDATVGDYIRLLDEFLDEKVAPCLGCDLCCSQRIPLTLPDVYTYAGRERDSVSAFLKEKAEILRNGKAIDIKLAQKADGACIFLDETEHRCTDHPHRSLVCHSYICLPQTPHARDLREELINKGEDALVGALFALELLEGGSENYPVDPAWQDKGFDDILLKDVLSPSVFEALK